MRFKKVTCVTFFCNILNFWLKQETFLNKFHKTFWKRDKMYQKHCTENKYNEYLFSYGH